MTRKATGDAQMKLTPKQARNIWLRLNREGGMGAMAVALGLPTYLYSGTAKEMKEDCFLQKSINEELRNRIRVAAFLRIWADAIERD